MRFWRNHLHEGPSNPPLLPIPRINRPLLIHYPPVSLSFLQAIRPLTPFCTGRYSATCHPLACHVSPSPSTVIYLWRRGACDPTSRAISKFLALPCFWKVFFRRHVHVSDTLCCPSRTTQARRGAFCVPCLRRESPSQSMAPGRGCAWFSTSFVHRRSDLFHALCHRPIPFLYTPHNS